MKKFMIVLLCTITLLGLAGCGNTSKAPNVEKKETVEYTPQEVKSILERSGMVIERSSNVIFIRQKSFLQYPRIAATLDGSLFDFESELGYDYMVDYKEGDYASTTSASSKKSCHFDVENQKELYDGDDCDKLSIEDSNAVYIEFYNFLNEHNLSRQELIDFIKWCQFNYKDL